VANQFAMYTAVSARQVGELETVRCANPRPLGMSTSAQGRRAVIRQLTHTGRPLGTEEFIQDLEKATQRRIALQKRGPREKIVTDRRQGELSFDP
jgi:hypothetical protein